MNILAQPHVYWWLQGRNALNFQPESFERAAQEYEQAILDEVHVAVAEATEMSEAEMLARTGARENQAEQTWTFHQVMLLDEMNSIAGDALENRRRNLLSEASAELERHRKQSQEHLQEYQQGVPRHLSQVQHEAQGQ